MSEEQIEHTNEKLFAIKYDKRNPVLPYSLYVAKEDEFEATYFGSFPNVKQSLNFLIPGKDQFFSSISTTDPIDLMLKEDNSCLLISKNDKNKFSIDAYLAKKEVYMKHQDLAYVYKSLNEL